MKIVAWVGGLALLLVVLQLLGDDVCGWLKELWDAVTGISLCYLLLSIFQRLQTSLTALAWIPILRDAYPAAERTCRS